MHFDDDDFMLFYLLSENDDKAATGGRPRKKAEPNLYKNGSGMCFFSYVIILCCAGFFFLVYLSEKRDIAFDYTMTVFLYAPVLISLIATFVDAHSAYRNPSGTKIPRRLALQAIGGAAVFCFFALRYAKNIDAFLTATGGFMPGATLPGELSESAWQCVSTVSFDITVMNAGVLFLIETATVFVCAWLAERRPVPSDADK